MEDLKDAVMMMSILFARADKELLFWSTSTSKIVSQCNCLHSLKDIQSTAMTGLESVEFLFWMSFPVQWEVFVIAYQKALWHNFKNWS